jgi:ABC-type bacteriocin/lantibiotic exporter with double-glycine peptidase domain
LDRKDKIRLRIRILIQVLLSALDLVSVAAVGVFTLLALSGEENPSSRFILSTAKQIGIAQSWILPVLGILTLGLFTARTVFSAIAMRGTLRFLGRISAELSTKLFSRVLNLPVRIIDSLGSQDVIFALSSGSNILILRVLGSFIGFITDAALAVMIGLFFVFASPAVAVIALVCGILLLTILSKATSATGSELGYRMTETEVRGRYVLQNALNTYRESYVRGTLGDFLAKFRSIKAFGSRVSADSQFLPNIGKYVIETSVLFIGALIGLIVFLTESPESGAVILAMFLAASSRIAPAIIRIQQSNIAIRGAIGESQMVRKLLAELDAHQQDYLILSQKNFSDAHTGFEPDISINNLSYCPPGSQKLIFRDLTMNIQFGQIVSITGPSGSGKSTFLDLIIGLNIPDSGSVLIGGQSPSESIELNTGAISYLPQDVWIAEGTVASNVTLGFDSEEVTEETVSRAISASQLTEVLHGEGSLAAHKIIEGGKNLSGGQKQRLGLARALVTNPRILLLDEPTSRLDKKTEAKFLNYLASLRGNTTVVIVTHSPAVVEFSDVCYHISNSTLQKQI